MARKELQPRPVLSMPQQPHRPSPATDEVESLAAELRRRVRGEVRFDDGGRALYATDASNYRQVPIGVVLPRDSDDVIATVTVCRNFDAPVLARGGGTSLAGQCCNVAVVMDFSKYMRGILEINPEERTARVQPAVVLDDLRHAAEEYHLTFGPDPATHSHCTLGGMIGNNSCGVHSVMAGKTDQNVAELEILTYDGLRLRVGKTSDDELQTIVAAGGRRGEIYGRLKELRDRYGDLIRARFPKIPRRVSGYNLDELLPENGFHIARALVGSEGTCVTVLEAQVNLVHSPPGRALLVLGYPDVYRAADDVPEIMDLHPIALEGFDDRLIHDMREKGLHLADIGLLPQGQGWLMVEFGGETRQEAQAAAHKLMNAWKERSNAPHVKLFDDPAQAARIWTVRESALGASANGPGRESTWPGWEDSAVPPENEGRYLRGLRQLMDRYDYEGALYGHLGQGCIHVRMNFDLETSAGIAKYLSFINAAADLVLAYGGSLSGEHGDGQSRAALLPKMFGNELMQAFREFKAIWDPHGKMNPGKIVEAYHPDQNLRLGTDYNPWSPSTFFQFPDDNGSFDRATLRCVGVGKCRREGGGTMCPSYRVTHEEQDSTRGRARLLFEMLQGQVIGRRGWRDPAVKDALDLCLACKGCKGDCPVQVDMATYKAEFLAHYYAGRLRPMTGYTMGLIYWWARLASHAPGVANFFTQTAPFDRLTKRLGGIAAERRIPAFAPRTFKAWFRNRDVRNAGNPKVILWADTFNNYFHPETARAAVRVLEAAGFQVLVPSAPLCCGRPLYDYGFLTQARNLLRQILAELKPEIEAGIPMVGLEPSCTAVFRDEMTNLFPHNADAKRLRQQTFTLGEFLDQYAPDFEFPQLARQAVVQGHCHHRAIMRLDHEEAILTKLGLDYQVLDSGCCGMAGAFGFERGEHYDISMKAGERVLLPAVRHAAKETLIIADGFSCREQIEQATDRRALHLAQVIEMALDTPTAAPPGPYPEHRYLTRENVPDRATFAKRAVVSGAAIIAGAALMWG